MTDRSGVKQPVGQKFLTNVAVVRHRAKGQEYQVGGARVALSTLGAYYTAAKNLQSTGRLLQEQAELLEVWNRN